MEVILLERVGRLGKMGDVVSVKNGYARNFLLPRGKALRANDDNKKQFEQQREKLEEQNTKNKNAAEKLAKKLDGKTFTAIRQAGETGHLYGSVSTKEIADLVSSGDITVERAQVRLDVPIKAIGLHKIILHLHGEVDAYVTINVARTPDEAKRQEKGEDLTKHGEGADKAEKKQELLTNAEAIFEKPPEVEGETTPDTEKAE
jgi:large subunit ribosomal protein L9